jgi:hexosaminidase
MKGWILLLVSLAVLNCVHAELEQRLGQPLWPMPTISRLGKNTADLSPNFKFTQTSNTLSDRLERACERYTNLVGVTSERRVSHLGGSVNINECSVSVREVLPSDKEKASLTMDVNESYQLVVSSDGKCQITSETVWGAMHAMETFAQLLTREDGGVVTNYAPVNIEDKPRYTHRGILMDSARHFLSKSTIEGLIDTLPMSKFNVLHWHAVDAQSFPVDTPSAPEMVRGAFGGNPAHSYSMEDLKAIDDYATDRGVRIIYEFDGPGHTASWGKGYPDILSNCPQYTANVNNLALNVVLDKTYDVLAAILKDVVTTTGTKFMHLGGDEVVYGCWAADDIITTYMKENNIDTYPQLLDMYVQRGAEIVEGLGATSIFWEDTFSAGVRPPKSTIFDVWTDAEMITNVTEAGYKVIAAPQEYWYLDHADNTWMKMYTYEPTVGLSDRAASLIIGGETSMWGEKVDETNILPKIWPTAAAVGERLWSVKNATRPAASSTEELQSLFSLHEGETNMQQVEERLVATDDGLSDATDRLLKFRCRMTQRGYGASPFQPGYCPEAYV